MWVAKAALVVRALQSHHNTAQTALYFLPIRCLVVSSGRLLFALFSRYMIKALMQILIFNFQKMRRLILNEQHENIIHLEFQKHNAEVQELLLGQIILIPNLNGTCFL